MENVYCVVSGCKSWPKINGKCLTHSQERCTEMNCANFPKFGGKCPVHKEDEVQSVEVEKEEQAEINGNGYYGGKANQPHVHVYAGGAHLKLGGERYNLVQNGKKHAAVESAYEALRAHAWGAKLKPWVDAALEYFGVEK